MLYLWDGRVDQFVQVLTVSHSGYVNIFLVFIEAAGSHGGGGVESEHVGIHVAWKSATKILYIDADVLEFPVVHGNLNWWQVGIILLQKIKRYEYLRCNISKSMKNFGKNTKLSRHKLYYFFNSLFCG